MRVHIKQFEVAMEIKTNGIELEVRTPDNQDQVGDLVITKTKLIWCRGQTTPEHGTEVTWDEFIKFMDSQ